PQFKSTTCGVGCIAVGMQAARLLGIFQQSLACCVEFTGGEPVLSKNLGGRALRRQPHGNVTMPRAASRPRDLVVDGFVRQRVSKGGAACMDLRDPVVLEQFV